MNDERIKISKLSSLDVWESNYAQGDIIYAPYTETFSAIISNYKSNDFRKLKLLEIGCGTGNNLWFAGVYGVDFSKSAIEYSSALLSKHDVKHKLKVADASSLDFQDQTFDIIIDRAALQHNKYSKCKKIISEVLRVLKQSGLFVLNVTSENHPQFGKGNDLNDGSYFNKDEYGERHFNSLSQLYKLLEDFEIIKLESHTRFNNLNQTNLGCVYHVSALKK